MLIKYTPILIVVVLAISYEVFAEDLAFPHTESEIVQALRFKDRQIEHNGVTYKAINGKAYKIINGIPYRVRGVAGVIAKKVNLFPKVGAIVTFDTDKDIILPDSHHILDLFGRAMINGLSGSVLLIAGHTDSHGEEVYNLDLAKRRAISVKKYLTEHYQIEADRLPLQAFGESSPIASNESEYGRAKNRRVEFIRIR